VATRKRSSFDGTLKLGERELWTESFGVSVDDDDDRDSGTGLSVTLGDRTTSSTTNVNSFEIDEPGDYQFVAHQTQADLRVEDMSLLVRMNARLVHVPSCVGGFVLVVLGVVGGIVGLIRSSNKPKQED